MRSEGQLARLLRLVPYLADRPGVETKQVAMDFGITARQVIKDLEILQFCGLPGGYVDDLFDVDIEAVRQVGKIDFSNADVLARPLKLRTAEAASLLAALKLVVEVAGSSTAADSALHKLELAIGDDTERVSVSVEQSDPALRSQLAQVIAKRELLQLRYRSPRRTAVSAAEVEPVELRLVDGFTYLDAWSRESAGWRSYRLDRIISAHPLGEQFPARERESTGWFDEVQQQLTIEVTNDAAWVSEYYPTTAVEHRDGRMLITFPVASEQWAVGLLLRLGKAVLSVSDEELWAEARTRAARALDRYQEGLR